MPPIQGTFAWAGFSFTRYPAGHIVKADTSTAARSSIRYTMAEGAGLVAEVGRDEVRGPALRPDGGYHLLATARIPSGKHHTRAAPGQGQRDDTADATVSSGDQRGSSIPADINARDAVSPAICALPLLSRSPSQKAASAMDRTGSVVVMIASTARSWWLPGRLPG